MEPHWWEARHELSCREAWLPKTCGTPPANFQINMFVVFCSSDAKLRHVLSEVWGGDNKIITILSPTTWPGLKPSSTRQRQYEQKVNIP